MYLPEFIGRTKELSILSKLNQNILEGRSQSLLINGSSGSGRKRLLMEISEEYTREIDYYASRADGIPYSIIEQLVTKIIKISIAKPKLNHLINHLPVLAEVFPKLKTMFKNELETFDSVIFSLVHPEEFLSEFLIEFLAASDTRIVVCIYNAEKIDEKSLEILKNILAIEEVVLGVVGVGEHNELGELYSEGLTIQALPIEDYEIFLSSLFGNDSFLNEQFVERLYLISDKNLTKTVELVQYLADTKQLYIKNYCWHMIEESIHQLKMPETTEWLLGNKIQLLSNNEKWIYQVLSLINMPIIDQPEFLSTIAQITNTQSMEKVLQAIGTIYKHGLLLRLMTSYDFPSITFKEYIQNTREMIFTIK